MTFDIEMSLVTEQGSSKTERRKYKSKIYMERVKKKKAIAQASFDRNFDDSGLDIAMGGRDTDEGEFDDDAAVHSTRI